MVFVLERRVLSAIFERKMEGIRMKEMRSMLVLPGSYGERQCTGQKVQACMVSLQR